MKNKTITMQNVQDEINEVNKKHYVIINYILNKNSHSIAGGGMNYEKIVDELQDFEGYLAENIY